MLIISLSLFCYLLVCFFQKRMSVSFSTPFSSCICSEVDKSPTKNLYLDVGANRGDMLFRFFEKRHRESTNNPHAFLFPYNPSTFRVVAFEALRVVHEKALLQLQELHPFEIFWVAVSNSSGQLLRLYRDKTQTDWGEWGATIRKEFVRGGEFSDFVDVPTLDFSTWLQDNARLCDEVLLKMNIEGAEYQVLDKMISDGTLCLIDHALMYFHGTHTEILRARVEGYRDAFSRCGTHIAVWHLH